MPLHIAAMQQGKEAETVVTALLNAYPEGAKHKDNVCALLNPIAFRAAGCRHPAPAASPYSLCRPRPTAAPTPPLAHTAPAVLTCVHHVNDLWLPVTCAGWQIAAAHRRNAAG